MLAEVTTNSWNYGGTVYAGHSILGRIALKRGDRATAREELRAAGRTPVSPQLYSYGLEFTLARQLLQHAEPADREAVVGFLDDVAKFWAIPNTKTTFAKQDALKRRELIDQWKQEIRAGKIPSSPPGHRNRWQ